MEVAVEKAHLVEENMAMALGGQTGVQIGSAPPTSFESQGSHSQAMGFSRIHQAPTKGG